jgi:hypothetical protein
VLAYLSRYTHRVAISNRRIIGFDGTSVTFRYKDYRRAAADRQQVELPPSEWSIDYDSPDQGGATNAFKEAQARGDHREAA